MVRVNAVIVLVGPENFVVSRYCQASDHLLKFRWWEVVIIEYVKIGKASFSVNQAEENDSGKYFPTMEIELQAIKHPYTGAFFIDKANTIRGKGVMRWVK